MIGQDKTFSTSSQELLYVMLVLLYFQSEQFQIQDVRSGLVFALLFSSTWFKHILLSNIYNRIEHKFYNLYEVLSSIIQT